MRNLTGYTGLALLAAWTLGSGLSWVLPLGYAVLSLFAPTTGQIPEWAWSVQAASDGEAAFIAGVLLLIGLTLIARSGARQRLDETL